MKMTVKFNEDGFMANGKEFRKQARALNEKELNIKARKAIIRKHKNRGDNQKLNKPIRGRRELFLES